MPLPIPEPPCPALLPLLQSIQELLDNPTNGFIMRFKANATLEEMQAICRELAGGAGEARFRGACTGLFNSVRRGGGLGGLSGGAGQLSVVRWRYGLDSS